MRESSKIGVEKRAAGEGAGQIRELRKSPEGEVRGYAVYQVPRDKKTEIMEVQELSLDDLLRQEDKILFRSEEEQARALGDLEKMKNDQRITPEEYSELIDKISESEFVEAREKEAEEALKSAEEAKEHSRPELEVIESSRLESFRTVKEADEARRELEEEVERRNKDVDNGVEGATRMPWEEYKRRFKMINKEKERLKKEEFEQYDVKDKLRAVS